MRRIPVDCSRVRFLGTAKVAERAKYTELSDGSRRRIPDQQDTDEQGRPLWVVDVLIDDPEAQRAEVAGVKIASFEVPTTQMGVPVEFIGLVCLPYVAQGTGRVAMSFTAESIKGIGQVSRPPAGDGKAA